MNFTHSLQLPSRFLSCIVSFTMPCLLAGFAATQLTAAESTSSGKKKVVFIAGKPSHARGEHEHRAGCMLLADHLNRSGLAIEPVVTTNGWPADASIFDNAAAVVIYSDGGNGHPAMKQLELLKSLAKRGTGIGCIHYAVEIPKGAPGDLFLDVIGGYFETNWSVNPHWHAQFQMPKHAITQGVNPYGIVDEWYYHMRFRPSMDGVTPILSDVPGPDTLSRPDGAHSGNPAVREAVARREPQHVMWAFERPQVLGGGRGFGFTGGHFHKNWQNDDQRRVVLNAIAWISGIDVPAAGVKSTTPTDEEMAANLDKK